MKSRHSLMATCAILASGAGARPSVCADDDAPVHLSLEELRALEITRGGPVPEGYVERRVTLRAGPRF